MSASSRLIAVRPAVEARILAGVSICTLYRRLVLAPLSPSAARASASPARACAALDRDGVDVLRRHGQVLGDPRRLRVRAGRRRREGGAAAAVRLRGERHGWRRAQVAVGGVQSSLYTDGGCRERGAAPLRCGHDEWAEQAEQQIHELTPCTLTSSFLQGVDPPPAAFCVRVGPVCVASRVLPCRPS